MAGSGLVLLAALLATLATTAWWASRRLAGPDPLDRALVAALAVLTVPQAVGLALGAVGLLRPGPTLLALMGLTVAMVVDLRRQPPVDAGSEPRPTPASGLTALLGLAAVIAGVALSLRLGFDASRSLH